MLWTVIANVHPSSFILNLLYYISSLGFKVTCRFLRLRLKIEWMWRQFLPFLFRYSFLWHYLAELFFLSINFFYVSYILMYISICPFAERFVRKGDTVRTWLVLQLLQKVWAVYKLYKRSTIDPMACNNIHCYSETSLTKPKKDDGYSHWLSIVHKIVHKMVWERIGSKARLDCVSPLSDALELMTNRILAIFETVLVLSFLSSSDELFIAVVYILNFQASRFQN